ncbi:MAG: hypothetical protein IPK64_17320 [bacterium]|nr:hypothetical protein [bacterium]
MSRRTALTVLVVSGLLSGTGRAAAAVPAPVAAAQRARTLEAITIEGAIDAPEVQFITSRDRLRFADDAGRRYRPRAREILADLRAPVRLRVMAPPGCPPFESIPSR